MTSYFLGYFNREVEAEKFDFESSEEETSIAIETGITTYLILKNAKS